jgi:hypothetical protein
MRCIIRTDLVNIMVIKDGTDAHLYTASAEGEVKKAGNKLKYRAEESPNAPLAQIMHTGVGSVQEKVLYNLPERNTVRRNINRMLTKN